MKKFWMVLGLLSLMLTVIAVPAAMADAPIEGRSGRAEVRFLEGMIDHHQMAIDMALDCLPKASTETVTTVCQNIIDAQTAEIATMQGWLLNWYNVEYSPMSMNDMMGMMGMSGDMHAHMEQMSGMMETMMGMEMSDEMRAHMEEMSGMMDMMSGTGMSGDMQTHMEQMSGTMETMMGMEMSDEMRAHMEEMSGMMDMMSGTGMSGDMHAHMEQMSGTMETMMGMEMSDEMRAHMEEMSGMMDMMSGMGGMNMEGRPASDPAMMMGMMAGLNRLEGVEYEIAFLESMIDHHDDAIYMSERILERAPEGTGHPELRDMAQQIIDDQTAEIATMETLLTELNS